VEDNEAHKGMRMKKSELIEKLKRIWQYRCDGCLADTGPITMLGTIDFVIKLQNSKEKKSD
jgi:hypothetical protein